MAKYFAKILVFTFIIGGLLLQATSPHEARADGPWLYVGGAAVTFLVGGGPELAWHLFLDPRGPLGGSEDEEEASGETITTVVVVSSGEGGGGNVDTNSNEESRSEESNGSSDESEGGSSVVTQNTHHLASISLPNDFQMLQSARPGYRFNETTLFGRGPNSQNGFQIRYQDLDHFADVTNPVAARREFKIDRLTSFAFRRPPGQQNESAEATISLNIEDLMLSTTNIPDTLGKVSYMLTIESPELGTVFRSSVEVTQGQMAVVNGDIPDSAFRKQPGGAALNNLSRTFSVEVPKDVNVVHFAVNFITMGIGEDCTLSFGLPDLRGRQICPGGPSPSPTPGGLTIPEAIDTSDDGVIDEDELREAIQYWIMGEPVPGADAIIDDATMLQLVQMWILGTTIDVAQSSTP